jgi:hypothetical protein
MLAPSAHPGGGRFWIIRLRYPRNAVRRERCAPSHRPLRAVPYGLPPAFLSLSFPFADVSDCGFVALTGSLSLRGRRGTLPVRGPARWPPSPASLFVKGDYTKPSDIRRKHKYEKRQKQS